MGFKDFVNKVQKSTKDYRVARKKLRESNAAKRREEEAAIALQEQKEEEAEELRIQQILKGKIKPITISINLQKGEIAYLSVPADRTASVERVVETTKGKSKKKGVIARGIVGGVLLGPVGALAGAATAKSSHTSSTTQQVFTETESIDSGTLVLTNQRVLFMGNQVLPMPYEQIIAYSFYGDKFNGYKFAPKYVEMYPNETFVIGGSSPSEMELYYKGITSNLVR
ncbi:MAG: hypothetical protein ABI397_01825 [Candidatus Saccharimonas sp.]